MNSIGSDFRKLGSKSPFGQSKCDETNENGFKYNSELKNLLKNPPKVTVDKEDDENEFSGFKPHINDEKF